MGITDDEVLSHPFFSRVRQPAEEDHLAPCKLVFAFDEELAGPMMPDEMTQRLRHLFIEEVDRQQIRNASTSAVQEPSTAQAPLPEAAANDGHGDEVTAVDPSEGDSSCLKSTAEGAKAAEVEAAGQPGSEDVKQTHLGVLEEEARQTPDADKRLTESVGTVDGLARQPLAVPGQRLPEAVAGVAQMHVRGLKDIEVTETAEKGAKVSDVTEKDMKVNKAAVSACEGEEGKARVAGAPSLWRRKKRGSSRKARHMVPASK